MAGCATGGVRWILRGEGAVLLLAALAFYTEVGSSWVLFAILFLAPDLSFLGYVAGPRVGAPVYNAAHSTIGPLLLGLAGAIAPQRKPRRAMRPRRELNRQRCSGRK